MRQIRAALVGLCGLVTIAVAPASAMNVSNGLVPGIQADEQAGITTVQYGYGRPYGFGRPYGYGYRRPYGFRRGYGFRRPYGYGYRRPFRGRGYGHRFEY